MLISIELDKKIWLNRSINSNSYYSLEQNKFLEIFLLPVYMFPYMQCKIIIFHDFHFPSFYPEELQAYNCQF